MMKKFATIGIIAAIHFGTSVLIMAISLSVATGMHPVPASPTLGLQILVGATRILHFPIISLSLYSRHWFPGNWIYVPMLVNSFLWAVGLYLLFILGKVIRARNRNGK
jgi:hypothetical protein